MFELIALIIFLVCVLGISIILYRKLPILATMPKNGDIGLRKNPVIYSIEKKIRAWHFNLFVKKLLLHKILSWVKVMTLKLEVKIDHILHGIRKNAQKIDKDLD